MKRQKPPSISRNLTSSLVLTVIVVSIFVMVLNYFNASRKARREIDNYAEEYISYITDVLVIPMWNVDNDSIVHIGRIYFQNDLIVQLKIIDKPGNVLFYEEKGDNGPLIKRAGKILHDGELLGNVEISLTSRYYKETNRRLLWSSIIITIIILFTLTIMTGIFLRMFLRKPLQRLGKIANSYAAGSYDPPKDQVPVQEFRQFVSTLGQMGEKITAQMMELQKAEEKYRSIYENAVEGIFQTTPDGRFLGVNPAMARILGYASSEELAESVNDVVNQLYVSPEPRKEFIRLIRESKVVYGFEAQLYRKNGGKIWVTINARSVCDENGELLFFEGFVEDTTERKHAEEALQKAHDELEVKVEERTEKLKEETEKLVRMNKLFVNRELRMKELKEEIKELKRKIQEGED